ncbi:MAG: hypothetical protein DME23_01735 [Verrucomicrobia bacterium]|nr:MAG: hypothetical protein DME23_01735 [Verrucomicrobiota bacterium]
MAATVCKLLAIISWMRRMVVRAWWVAWVLLAAVTARSNAAVLISEFMAVNNTTLTDQDGQYSDWIEIYNSGADTVDLDGWYLTDSSTDLTKWRFPATDLFPDSYLVVFASGKDRAVSGAELHTNFKLNGSGDYLALVMPDGATITSQYAPQFPRQRADVSYGLDLQTGAQLFFSNPTPGWANDVSSAGFAENPRFAIPGDVYTNNTLSLTLSVMAPTAVLHYTLDGTEPTEASAIYSAPIVMSASTIVRAKVFDPGLQPSATVSQNYTLLGSDVVNFSSNLPLIIINTFGRSIPDGTKIRANARFIETMGGRAWLTGAPDYDGWAGIALRGSSSLGFPKHSYAFETQDEAGEGANAALLGFPKDNDWVLYAPYTDKTLLRDFLAYELHGKMGHYSVRAKFVEVFVDSSRGRLTMSDYAGVYVFEEKIKRGKDRVDVTPLLPTDNNEPEVTGGYLIKKDRLDPGDSGFSTAHAGTLAYVDPKEQEITPAQAAWLSAWFDQFETALYGADFRDPVIGYSQFIDIDSFIDQQWIVEMSKNIDGYRLSNYMHKDRLGKLKMDPIWDWNLSFGNANYLNGWVTSGWYWTQTADQDYPWFRRLFQDPDFNQRYIDRWGGLRKDVFATSNLLARVDELAAFLNEAQVRNYQKWRILGTYVWPNWYIGKNYQAEINWMKQWIAGRLAWIDTNYTPAPVFSHDGGLIPVGFALSMSAPKGVIYCTLDGTDPRLPGGGISPRASIYSSSITLSANARVFARARNGTAWSPPTVSTFVVSTPPLVITEIMYHPQSPPAGSPYTAEDFEFIELKNIGATALDLSGIHFTNGIGFSFTGSAVTSLGPGQHLVIVKNLAAFTARYGAAPNLAGEYSGSLDNAGERLTLEGASGELILDFNYHDTWYPTTDGFGFSLVVIDEHAPSSAWGKGANWRASAFTGGSPGADDPPSNVPRVLINEALTHTDPPQVDSIELYNPNSMNVDIGNWYLTDQRAMPHKFRIPSKTIIQAQGYLVFTENDWNANPTLSSGFRLDSHGEEVYLFSADANGNLTGYSDGFSFGAAENGVSFGRYVISTGEAQYPAQVSNSLGGPNAGPRVGPIVVNEIRYHPALGDEEFVELKNITSSPVRLYDPNYPKNTWKLNGAGFTFPPNVEIPANGLLLLVASDPGVFRLKYNVPTNVPVFALYPGVLQNSGETLALQRPDTPDVDTNSGAIFVPYVDVDVVRYNDKEPWPTNADGFGPSLERSDAAAYGNDPINWRASYSPGTPGREKWENVESWKARYFTSVELANPAISGDAADPDKDGETNLQEYLSGTDPRDGQSCLKIESATTGSGTPQTISIRFNAVADRTYTVQYRNSLAAASWLKLTNVPPPLVSGMMDVAVPSATNSNARYFRVVTPWQP